MEEHNNTASRVVVVGGGMVANRFVEAMRARDVDGRFHVTVLADEPRPPYDRVALTSYFSGYSEIMELREQRKQQLGPRFNLKEFHEQFLSYGSAPVRVIKGLMTQ